MPSYQIAARLQLLVRGGKCPPAPCQRTRPTQVSSANSLQVVKRGQPARYDDMVTG